MAIELDLRLTKFRQIVADQIKVGVPDYRDVRPHVGAFGVETIERFSMVTPAARISFIGMRNIKRNNVGQLIGPCTMSVFVFHKDPYQNEAYGPAIDLAEKTADFIDMNRFGLEWAAAARVTDIDPIYSEAVDKIGASLVAITFEQEVQIGRSRHEIDEAGLYPDFYDPEVLAAGWPDSLKTNASSTMAVPNIFANFPGPTDPPEKFTETPVHPDEDETL